MSDRQTANHLFKNYGIGTGLRSPYYSSFLNSETRPRSVNWIEAISETFMHGQSIEKSRALNVLERLRENYEVALHGVSLSVGSMHGLDHEYLKKLKALVDRIQPIVVSDHLCWTRIHGQQTHDLNPLPYTSQLVAHVSDKIKQVQDFLGRRILIENVSSYLEFEQSTMNEEEFFGRVVSAADCGILLDINNVYVSSQNHAFDPRGFLSKLPHHRVGQIHLAGHTRAANRMLIDTHDKPVCDEVWDLYRWYGEHYGHASSMIERDGNFEAWELYELEIMKLKKNLIENPNQVELITYPSLSNAVVSGYSERDQEQWTNSIFSNYELSGILERSPHTARDRFNVYEEAFWIKVNEVISDDFVEFRKCVIEGSSEDGWDELVYEVISQNPPCSWSIGELGEVFLAGLKEIKHMNLGLAELEWAKSYSFFTSHSQDASACKDFSALSSMSEEALGQVYLAIHPSTRILLNQQAATWANSLGKVEQKIFSSSEWKGILGLNNQVPMLELLDCQTYLQSWVQSGLVTGWKLKNENDGSEKKSLEGKS